MHTPGRTGGGGGRGTNREGKSSSWKIFGQFLGKLF